MQGAEVLTRFTADTKDFDSKVKGLNTSIGSIAKGVLAATGITKAMGAAFSLVSRNMDSAIDRFDILNNFPKVMSNLGISAEDSQKSIDKLSKKLVGLPTTLQDGAAAVQRLTSKNGDVKKSTDLFLAMNNAILAGGASSQVQASAIEQLSQAYAKGKSDMMEWRSLMSAMPAQLKQVATAMGYVDADALGQNLRDGTVSMDEFMNTIDKLNKEGLPGFENFETQARNSTNGIRTAITNMNSRVAQGLEAMIKSINEGLDQAGLGSLANVFEIVGNTIRDTLKSLAPYLTKAIIMLAQFGNWINKNKDWLGAIAIPLAAFIATFATITKLIAIVKGVTAAIGVLNATLLANPIVLVIAAIVAVVAAFIYLWKHCDSFRNFWIGLWNEIVSFVQNAVNTVVSVFNTVVNFVKNNWQGLLLLLVNPFWGAFKLLYDNCSGFRNFINNFVKGIVNLFKSLPGQMISIGKNIISGIINGMTGMVGTAINKAKSIGKSILNGVKSVLGIHSPSTEFAFVGKMSVVGFTNELDKMQKQVQSQIAETFSISPQLSATTGMHYSPNVNVYNNVDVRQDPLGQMVNNIKTYSGGAKNDYNYGAGF